MVTGIPLVVFKYVYMIFDNYSDERGAILSKPSVNKRQDQIGSIFSVMKYIYNNCYDIEITR